MRIITTQILKYGEPVDITFNLDHLVSFRDDEDNTRLSFSNQEYAYTTKPIGRELRKYILSCPDCAGSRVGD